ncbi:hypothetical protein HanRHA438_Chr10g0447461 [Helianthus annuus]|nr:hypothetical protein HanRHA438_Chr10g0447461 [Helianthus annuus]
MSCEKRVICIKCSMSQIEMIQITLRYVIPYKHLYIGSTSGVSTMLVSYYTRLVT